MPKFLAVPNQISSVQCFYLDVDQTVLAYWGKKNLFVKLYCNRNYPFLNKHDNDMSSYVSNVLRHP